MREMGGRQALAKRCTVMCKSMEEDVWPAIDGFFVAPLNRRCVHRETCVHGGSGPSRLSCAEAAGRSEDAQAYIRSSARCAWIGSSCEE